MVDVGAHAVARAHVFARDHLVAGQTGFKTAHFDDRVALVHALDLTGDDRFAALEELLEDLFALGVAQTLQNHLLRVLSEAASRAVDVDVVDRALDRVARNELGVIVVNVGVHLLTVGLHQPGLVGNDEPAARGGEFARAAVDVHHHVGVFAREAGALHGARERELQHAEDRFLVDILFASEHVDELKHFAAVHFSYPLKFNSLMR